MIGVDTAKNGQSKLWMIRQSSVERDSFSQESQFGNSDFPARRCGVPRAYASTQRSDLRSESPQRIRGTKLAAKPDESLHKLEQS